MLVKFTPLHFMINTSFRGTYRTEFEVHVTLLSSIHPQNFDVTAYQVEVIKDEASRVMRSCGIAFVLAILEVNPDSVVAPIAEVACRSYGFLMHSSSCELDCFNDSMQTSFTAQESGAYLESPIQNQRKTPALKTQLVFLQIRLAVTSVQRAFPGHYLIVATPTTATIDISPFNLSYPPPSASCSTLARI